MLIDLLEKKNTDRKNNQFLEATVVISKLRNSIWFFGIPSWVYGIADRGVAALADGYLSAIEIAHILTASLFFLGWLLLKPDYDLDSEHLLPVYNPDSISHQNYLEATRARIDEMEKYHMIRQEYILPFPYLCQIYHLLNLKHLEEVHSFSLNNLKVVKVSEFQPTSVGGVMKFQTVLDSPINALRIWRQPIVEAELILHTPYTVELSIPVYQNRRIIVLFNALPINNTEHKLFIDIYSDLGWFKPPLQVLLHLASCLTLFEDLPYLHTLANRNIQRLVNLGRVSNHETMQLFNRFVDLYGAGIEGTKPTNRLAEAGAEA
ncbi:hypothetical protein H6G89_22350 [Oscillatoria sp. FACHB-1407]|uniref:hypothetical protein n=1 Tax=Oscillatoria sp. FACHB-1407 TaxID=2692847 RepID=UPI0016827A47|nr:hypothetical protein [Oscillatoria sp. FACHB-1407]MBD2463746.1 hypothetical protein [Oscillatoria sp. FACHB-1407]